MTLEIVGTQRKINSFIELISEIANIKEIARSGVLALYRGEESITLE